MPDDAASERQDECGGKYQQPPESLAATGLSNERLGVQAVAPCWLRYIENLHGRDPGSIIAMVTITEQAVGVTGEYLMTLFVYDIQRTIWPDGEARRA